MSFASPNKPRFGASRPLSEASTAERGTEQLYPPTPDLPEEEPLEAEGESFEEELDWGRIGALASGIVIGAVLGAGAALLLAPRSGADTRRDILQGVRNTRDRATSKWDDLADHVAWLSRRKKRQVRRGATKAGWAVQDLLDGLGHGRKHRRPKHRVEIEEE